MKVLLINDNSAHPNWGAQATPFALQEILKEKIHDCNIKRLSWDWIRMDWRVPRMGLLRRFEIRPDVVPHAAYFVAKLTRSKNIYPRVRDDFEFFAEQWMDGRMGVAAEHYVELVRWADVVVYNGENNLYRGTVEGCRSVFLMYLAKKGLAKPACAVNHTVHLTGVRPIMRAMIESVFPDLDLVTSREPCSFRALQDLGVSSARPGADVVFGLSETGEATLKVDSWLQHKGLCGRPYACLSASGLPVSQPAGGYDGALTALTRCLGRELGMPVVLLARDPSCQFLEDVAERTGNPYFGPGHHFSELWPLLRQASVLVTGHYHYAIIGAISGCPFVPLSVVNHKMTGVCEQLEWGRTEPYDATWLTPSLDAICREAKALVSQRFELSPRLAKRAAELGQLARATGDWIRDVVENAKSQKESGEVQT